MARYRNLSGVTSVIWKGALFLLVSIGLLYILGVHQKLGISLYNEQYIGLFFALIMFSVFIGVAARKGEEGTKVPLYDWVLAIVGLIVGLYLFIYYPVIVFDFAYITTERVIVGLISALLVLEALRRVIGWILVVIVAVFISYAYVAPYLGGPLKGNATDTSQLFNYLYFDASGGMISLIGIAATIGFAFILFGQVMLQFRGGDIMNDIALYSFGKYRGGTAKASVFGSSLVGSITGGPVTNVILTGSITIPLMKKHGYTGEQAGAVESVASTGGQIMPPVMGVAAFVMAEYLGVPYAEIALAALIPALLFYFCLFSQVDLLAIRNGIKGLTKGELPKKENLKKVVLIIPSFVILIYCMFVKGYTAQISGIYATATALIFLMLQPQVRKNWLKLIHNVFVDTGKTLIDITIVLAAAGIIVGVTGITGLGFNLAMLLVAVGDHGLFVLLAVSALVAFILGMGMPSVAAYTMVAVLIAPALADMGVEPIAAHLFVFYFAILCNFTPPIAMACFAAGPIAKASPNKIGIEAMKLGIVGFIVPFIFVYQPQILLSTNYQYGWVTFIISVLFALFSCFLLAVSIVGYFKTKLSLPLRIIFLLLSVLIFAPITIFDSTLFLNGAATLLSIILLVITTIHKKMMSSVETEVV
ncbi:TRAP transporter permease [Fredinandcohnia onubensis]|uniref:TRAP transporter permease n=1 Tax=Fredinandcohnia onubensis TaxID=1571209 RepID=UPI000C0BC924|nr:TRAP transporter fused permease subunit [Fredinandcohnia onubensis]